MPNENDSLGEDRNDTGSTKKRASRGNAIKKDSHERRNVSIDKFEAAITKFRKRENLPHIDKVEAYAICQIFLKDIDQQIAEAGDDTDAMSRVTPELEKNGTRFGPLGSEIGNLVLAKVHVRDFRNSLFSDLIYIISYKDIFFLLKGRLIQDFQNFLNGLRLYRYLVSVPRFWKIFWPVVISVVGIVVAGLVLRYI